MTIEMHLRIVGVLLILLGGANVLVPRHFNWKRDLMAAPLLTRQVFWVHLAFLVLTLELFGWATFLCASALLEPGPLSRAMLAGMAIFWWVRLLFQFFFQCLPRLSKGCPCLISVPGKLLELP